MRRIRTVALALVVAVCASAAHAATVGCINAAEYQRAAKADADLSARFDLAAIAQELLDLLAATRDLKVRVKACQSHADTADKPDCTVLLKRYDDQLAAREALASRLNLALGMQEYLATLKLRLERPRCEK